MKRELKRTTPKDYSFLDLVAPSYNRLRITPKFAYGGGIFDNDADNLTGTNTNQATGTSQATGSDDDWIRKILEFEMSKGSGSGTGLTNMGYNAPYGFHWVKDNTGKDILVDKKTNALYHGTGVFDDAPTTMQQAIDRFKTEYLPLVANLPMGMRQRAGDYIFNTGRSFNDLLLYNAGKISLDDINSNKIFTNEWNQYGSDIEKMYSDPNFINKLTQSKSDVYKTTGSYDDPNDATKQIRYSLGNPNPKYDASWQYRVGMFDDPSVVNQQVNQNVSGSSNQVANNQVANNQVGNTNQGVMDNTQAIIGSVTTGNEISKRRENESQVPVVSPPTVNVPGNSTQVNSSVALPKTFGANQWGTTQSTYTNPDPYSSGTQAAIGSVNTNTGNQIGSVTMGSNQIYDLYNNNSVLFNQNQPISTNQEITLPKKQDPYNMGNQWELPQIPANAQRPSAYVQKPQTPKEDTEESTTKTNKNNSPAYNINPYITGINLLNTGLNTIGGMRNMSRERNQENLNSFITQQPEAVYPNKRMLYGDKTMFAKYGGEYAEGGMYPEGGSVYDPEENIGELVQYKKGGIYIKPENKGKFTAWASSHGMSVQEAASHVMANKDKYSSTTVKRANFAKNASKWNHEDGGEMYSYGGHYIPQDVPYLAGKFVPNPIDLQEFKKGGMIKRADGTYSKRGLWDNIRDNKGSGKKPTKEMLKQEKKIKKGYKAGGEYMEGNEYEISGAELERLRSLGYDVEMI